VRILPIASFHVKKAMFGGALTFQGQRIELTKREKGRIGALKL
jgi:hypothetical protein